MKSTIDRQAGWATALPFYYGWLILAASAISEMLIVGATSYSAGLFVLPLQAEFGLSRASANSAVPLLYLGGMIMVPFAGRALDRYPIRPVMLLGTLSFCLALLMIALAPSLPLMVVALMLPAALGYVMLGPLTTATLASRWFFRRRGLALGIAAIATSGGGFTVVPLMSQAIKLYGWRAALLYEAGAFALIILALTVLVLRDNPAKVGLDHHPETRDKQEPALAAAPPASNRLLQELRRWKDVLGNRAFWAPSLTIATVSGLCQGIVVSVVPYGVQLGFAATTAALLISAFSIAAAITKILAGIVSDLLDKRILLLLALASMVAALALLCLVPSFAALLVACCLAGVALGAALPISAALIAARFGSARFGATMGWTYVLIAAFTIAASWIAGAAFDRTGSYHTAFELFLAACVAAALLALAVEGSRPKGA